MPALCLAQSETQSVLRPYPSSAPRYASMASALCLLLHAGRSASHRLPSSSHPLQTSCQGFQLSRLHTLFMFWSRLALLPP